MNKNDIIKLGYYLGQKDMLASVLMETKDKIKLPKQAMRYKKEFEKEHFSHYWHINK